MVIFGISVSVVHTWIEHTSHAGFLVVVVVVLNLNEISIGIGLNIQI